MPGPPPASETKALILSRHDKKWLDEKIAAHKAKYKGAFPESLMYWMIASQNKIAVADIKAGTDGGEGEDVSLAALEDMLQDEDIRDQWTRVLGGKFEQPKQQAKYCVPSAVVVDMIRGETSTQKPKMDVVISDGSGTCKVVAYAKAVDLLTEAKVKVGSVIRLPLLNGQYGHWTRKGTKGVPDEEVLWYKLSLPPFGNVYKLDTPVTAVLKNLDQVVVRPKDACYVDGVVTNLDANTKDTCSKCYRWYDEKKASEHKACKGAEILEVTSYDGTITTTSGQIYKLVWGANARNGELTVREPKIKVADDTVRIFGTLTERSSVLVTGFKVIDPSEMHASEDSTDEDVEAPVKSKEAPKRLPKAAARPEPAEEDDEEEDEVPAPPARKSPFKRLPEPAEDEEEVEEAPAPRRRVQQAPAKAVPADEDEEEAEDEEDAPAPPPRRRVASGKASASVDEDDGEDETEEDEAPSPPPRRRVATKAAPEPQDEPEADEEDADEEEAPAQPAPRRRVQATLPAADDEDEAPAPKAVKNGAKVKVVRIMEDDEDAEAEPIVTVKKVAGKNGSANKVTEFIVTALANLGNPQRIVIVAKGAVKAGLVECDDPKDVEALKSAFQPHLETAIEAGAIKWADDKRQSVWIAKEA